MTRPHAVPVWIKSSMTRETTALGAVTEELRADGILRLEPESLVLEVEIVHSTTTVGMMGGTTDTDSMGSREYDIPFEKLVGARLQGRWWRLRLRIQTNSLKVLEGLPGARQGIVNLRLSRRNWAAARRLINELEFERADLELRRVTGDGPPRVRRDLELGDPNLEPPPD